MSGANGHLSAAEGWLSLGAPAEAWQALEDLPPEQRATGEALTLRVRIFLALGRYGDAMMVVLPLVKAAPERAELHFLAARALAKLGKIAEAKEHALQVSTLAPELREEMLECEVLAALW